MAQLGTWDAVVDMGAGSKGTVSVSSIVVFVVILIVPVIMGAAPTHLKINSHSQLPRLTLNSEEEEKRVLKLVVLQGLAAFVAWRSAYWGYQVI